eukprot:9781688-Alexandrium_andersonii.AAC.1
MAPLGLERWGGLSRNRQLPQTSAHRPACKRCSKADASMMRGAGHSALHHRRYQNIANNSLQRANVVYAAELGKGLRTPAEPKRGTNGQGDAQDVERPQLPHPLGNWFARLTAAGPEYLHSPNTGGAGKRNKLTPALGDFCQRLNEPWKACVAGESDTQ